MRGPIKNPVLDPVSIQKSGNPKSHKVSGFKKFCECSTEAAVVNSGELKMESKQQKLEKNNLEMLKTHLGYFAWVLLTLQS